MKNKRLLSLILGIFVMFFSVNSVNAAPVSSFKNANITNKNSIITTLNANKKGNLSYYISKTTDFTAYLRESTKFNNNSVQEHGSINIFGYDEDWYETSEIIQDNSNLYLSGIYPVFYIGNGKNLDVNTSFANVYNYLNPNNTNTSLTSTKSGIEVTVTPEYAHNNQFVALKYTAKNTNSSATTISMAGYSLVALDGVSSSTLTPENNIGGKGAIGFSMNAKTSSNKDRKMYVITDNYSGVLNNKDANYWIGDSNAGSSSTNEYSQAFKNSTQYVDIDNNKSASMAFSWNNISIGANETVTRTVLIGLGDIEYDTEPTPEDDKKEQASKPSIDATGNTEFNLENDKEININVNYVVPTAGNDYKLYFKLNDQQTPTVVTEADLTKKVDATMILNLIDSEDLDRSCDKKNILTTWIGPADNSSLDSAIVSDTHEFTIVCTVKSEQLGVNTNYLILGLILIGGIGVYVYGRKHNKFPQV